MLHARRPPSVYSQDDPLSFVSRPPDAETELERKARLKREADSKRISDIIDEQLKVDKRNYEKSKQDVRVRLLSLFSLTSRSSPRPAPPTGSGGIRKVHPTKAIPTHVQPRIDRQGTRLLAHRCLF